jgi:hypothetical protein
MYAKVLTVESKKNTFEIHGEALILNLPRPSFLHRDENWGLKRSKFVRPINPIRFKKWTGFFVFKQGLTGEALTGIRPF